MGRNGPASTRPRMSNAQASANLSNRRILRGSLESIRAQTYPRDRLETIVIADGSGDASAALARSFLVGKVRQCTNLADRRPTRCCAGDTSPWGGKAFATAVFQL